MSEPLCHFSTKHIELFPGVAVSQDPDANQHYAEWNVVMSVDIGVYANCRKDIQG
jgi:hypothetical protein